MKYDELERIMHINNFTQHQQDEKRSLGKLIFHISFKSDIEYNQGNGRRIEPYAEIRIDKSIFNIRYLMI